MRIITAIEIEQHPLLTDEARQAFYALREQRARAAASSTTRLLGPYTLLSFAEQRFRQAVGEFNKGKSETEPTIDALGKAAVHWLYELIRERKLRTRGRPTNAVRDTLRILVEIYHDPTPMGLSA